MFEITQDNNCSFENKEITVEILDSIMGSGKTTNVLKWIDKNCHKEKFIYVSPLTSEVGEGGRVHRDLEVAKFHSPDTEEHNTKTDHLLELLQKGLNISCTHSLYLLMTNKHFNEIKKQNYIVIIDEELGVMDSYDTYSQFDLESLVKLGCITKQESDGMLLWIKDDENFDKANHAYYRFKRHVENGVLYSTKRKNNMMVTQLPIKLFTVAKRTIIITYMFEGNILSSFLKLKGINYTPFKDVSVGVVDKSKIKSLITLYEPKNKWKKIETFKLSNTWYTSNGKGNSTGEDIDFISKFIECFARQTGCSYNDLMYTFPKYRKWDQAVGVNRSRKVIKPKRLIDRVEADGKEEKCWIATQTRATNDYSHKTHLIHLYNRYPNMSVKSYLQDYGNDVDDDVFALSELVQWVWRSSIRNNNPITICIASPRMKQLFVNWLDS